MECVRDKWTDERLDYLNRKVDDGFARLDRRLEKIEEKFDKVDERFAQVDLRFAQVDARIDGLQRSMFHGLIAVIGVQVTLFAALVALILALH